MPIINDSDVAFRETAPGLRSRRFIDQERGAGAITLGELIMSPGTTLTPHTHKIEEAMFIVEGTATVTLGDATYELDANGALLAPAGVKHCLANNSDKPMRFLFFYPAVQVQIERL